MALIFYLLESHSTTNVITTIHNPSAQQEVEVILGAVPLRTDKGTRISISVPWKQHGAAWKRSWPRISLAVTGESSWVTGMSARMSHICPQRCLNILVVFVWDISLLVSGWKAYVNSINSLTGVGRSPCVTGCLTLRGRGESGWALDTGRRPWCCL